MLKCTGICSECGRCMNKEDIGRGTSDKERMLVFPSSFIAEKKDPGLGLAFDMGTTTVVGMLWNLETGQMLAAASGKNPQRKYGSDVISRIAYIGKDRDKLAELRECITECMNEITDELYAKAGPAFADVRDLIRKVCVCGNTTMSHIFAGFSPATLAVAPFQPAYTGTVRMTGKEAMLNVPENAQVTVLPNIAGHVGGDITAGMLASEILDMKGLTAFVDLGTNGEIVLTDGERTCACSTAAGPAFEGNERMRGSELIETVAKMLEAGHIDKTGRLHLENATVTQKDIRDVQLAKGAIRTGIEIMLKHFDKTAEDIDRIVLAGAFGNYIDKKSAVRIGLLPDIPQEKIISLGNTAGAGVAMALTSSELMGKAENIPDLVEHVELAEDTDFQKIYIGSINF